VAPIISIIKMAAVILVNTPTLRKYSTYDL
jgi:hypothetical protein